MKNDLIRSYEQPAELRADPDTGVRTLFGHAAVFNTWAEIDSRFEGHFREQIAPGAFSKTIRESGDRVKVLYDHGYDPVLGNKPLGKLTVLREDDKGLWYEAELLDTDYNRNFVVPALEAGVLGASFRFRAVKDEWKDDTKLPERTIREAALMELGPVTFPAYQAASAGVRSWVDMELWRSLRTDEDREAFARLLVMAHDLDTPDAEAERGEPSHSDDEPPAGHSAEPDKRPTTDDLIRRLALLKLRGS